MVKPFQFLSALLASMSLALAVSWMDRPMNRELIQERSDPPVFTTSTAFISTNSVDAHPTVPIAPPANLTVAPVVIVVYPPTAANPSYNIVVAPSPNAGTQTYQIVVAAQ